MRTSSRPRSMWRSRSSKARSPSWSAPMRWCGRRRHGRSRSTRRSPTGRRLNTCSSSAARWTCRTEIEPYSMVRTDGPSLGSDRLSVLAKRPFKSWSRGYAVVNMISTSESSRAPMLAGTVARHPMHHLGGFFARPRPFLPGEFVTTDSGTGLVHMAPDHGEDDFELCKAHGIDPVFAVEADGKYREDWLWLGGQGSGHQQQVQRPRRADLLRPARGRRPARGLAPTTSTATRIHGGPRPRSSTAAPRNGSSRWTGRCVTCGEGRCAAVGDEAAPSTRSPASAPPARHAGHRRHPLRAREGPQPPGLDGRRAARLGAEPPARLGRADRFVRRPQDRQAAGRP